MATPEFRESRVLVGLADGSLWWAIVKKDGTLSLNTPHTGPKPTASTPASGSGSIALPQPTEPTDKKAAGTGAGPDGPSSAIPPTEVVSDHAFRAKLRSIMTDNKYDRVVKKRLKGKLDMKGLWRSEAGAINLFKQKQARKNKQYNIVLMVDTSGSMLTKPEPSRLQVAAECAQFLADSFEGLVNLSVMSFNHYILEHKDWSASPKGVQEKILTAGSGVGTGCNHDLDAVFRAFEKLEGREGQNILIFLSDGEPADCFETKGRGGYSKSYLRLKEAHDSDGFNRPSVISGVVKARKDIQTIGIGIQNESYQIPDSQTVNNLEELKPAILRALQRTIKRG